MEQKFCPKCEQTKDLDLFYKRPNGKLYPDCQECKIEYMRRYRESHREEFALYREKTKEHRISYNRKYSEEHREELRLKAAKYNALRKEKVKLYYQLPEIKERCKKNRERWCEENRDHYNEWCRNYYKNNINHRIAVSMRNSLSKCVKGLVKYGKAMVLLGCTVDEFKLHIESLWVEGMTWDNYGVGGWSFDHIKPIAAFDLSQESEQRECFHWSNFQPMWLLDNISKNSRFNGELLRPKSSKK